MRKPRKAAKRVGVNSRFVNCQFTAVAPSSELDLARVQTAGKLADAIFATAKALLAADSCGVYIEGNK